MKLQAFANADQAAAALADAVAADLAAAVAQRGRAVLAVSGGRSPVPFFQALSTRPLPWQQVTVTLVDERCVADDHPDRNAGLVRAHLLQNQAAAAAFHPLDGVDDAAWVTPDVVVLGMGDDGHTASLFPGAANLAEGLAPANPGALIVVVPPVAPHTRISMTLAEILRAPRRYLAIAGSGKRAVLEQAAQRVDDALPISHLLQTEGVLDVYWAG